MGQAGVTQCCEADVTDDTRVVAVAGEAPALGLPRGVAQPAGVFHKEHPPEFDEKATDVDTDDDTTADTAAGGLSPPVGRVPSSEAAAPPADFGGSWLCTRVTGDMDGLLTELGLGPAMLEAAKAAGYGVRRQLQNIAQVGDTFLVQNILKEPATMRFRVGAGLQSTVDQDGKPVLIDPKWEEAVLCVTSKKPDGTLIVRSRRYLSGDTMVLELTSPKGAVVQRFFERR
mmetsp:Transcript_47046/g.145643  ORF Transcript_47046/g.145643 Transcript_47046/m.145643 type:complete len:229 (+) Transcript_47046:127-813(+)